MRAGKLITGEENVMKTIRSQEAKLVIIAEDASSQTLKKALDKCQTYNISCMVIGSRDELGQSIGKDSIVILAVKDSGFAKILRNTKINLTEVKKFD
jgi:ribosomal protein L7Ae-like RNA K-turn-binding protein